MLIGWHVPNVRNTGSRRYGTSPPIRRRMANGATGTPPNGPMSPPSPARRSRAGTSSGRPRCGCAICFTTTLPGRCAGRRHNLGTLKAHSAPDGALWLGRLPPQHGELRVAGQGLSAPIFLFPACRAACLRDYAYNLAPDGAMSFRLGLPLGTRLQTERACADGQFGSIMLVYREWKLSGDTDWLRGLWPAVAAALAYAWSPANPDRWDPKKIGVLQGRQHHTLDMELFGQWLAHRLLSAPSRPPLKWRMPSAGEADSYREMAARGRRFVDEPVQRQLLRAEDRPVGQGGAGALPYRPALAAADGRLGRAALLERGARRDQISARQACFIDQLVSQWHARIYGLPDIFAPERPWRRCTPCGSSTQAGAARRAQFGPRLRLWRGSGTIVAPGRRRGAAQRQHPYAQETLHGMEYALGGFCCSMGSWPRPSTLCRRAQARWPPAQPVERDGMRLQLRPLTVEGRGAAGFIFDLGRHMIGFFRASAVTALRQPVFGRWRMGRKCL